MVHAEQLDLGNPNIFCRWRKFLQSLGIVNFRTCEIDRIDETVGLYDDEDHLLATGSIAGNTLKYIGVRYPERGGHCFSVIVSKLINLLAQKNIFHVFVFTKLKYVLSFERLGFHEVDHIDLGALLETGDSNTSDYVKSLPRIPNPSQRKVACVVLNANPFTLGHRYLIERATKENDYVYVFVVQNNDSLFNTRERITLVKQGTQDLKNVVVVAGDSYVVSYVTFPAYFISAPSKIVRYQTSLDAQIFKDRIAAPLSINVRYVGSEPFSRTTKIYNHILKKRLPPEVDVKILPRKRINNRIVTATGVRDAIADDKINDIVNWVPKCTMTFIHNNLLFLQLRIKKGLKINGN